TTVARIGAPRDLGMRLWVGRNRLEIAGEHSQRLLDHDLRGPLQVLGVHVRPAPLEALTIAARHTCSLACPLGVRNSPARSRLRGRSPTCPERDIAASTSLPAQSGLIWARFLRVVLKHPGPMDNRDEKTGVFQTSTFSALAAAGDAQPQPAADPADLPKRSGPTVEEEARARIATLEREAKALGEVPEAALLFHEVGLLWEDPLRNPRNAAVAFQAAYRLAPGDRKST